MKNLILLFTAFTLTIMYSCQPKGEPCPEIPERHPNGVYEAVSKDSIPLDTFNVWIQRWDDTYRNYMANDSLHYFSMPLVDLAAILKNRKNDGARLYMGMAYDTSGELSPHTMIVGTVKGVADLSLIMDYTAACPKRCY